MMIDHGKRSTEWCYVIQKNVSRLKISEVATRYRQVERWTQRIQSSQLSYWLVIISVLLLPRHFLKTVRCSFTSYRWLKNLRMFQLVEFYLAFIIPHQISLVLFNAESTNMLNGELIRHNCSNNNSHSILETYT